MKFEVGDKVRLVKGGTLGWEETPWWETAGLKLGQEYVVSEASFTSVRVEGYPYGHAVEHFELAERAGKLEPELVGTEVKAEIEGKTYKVKVLEKL